MLTLFCLRDCESQECLCGDAIEARVNLHTSCSSVRQLISSVSRVIRTLQHDDWSVLEGSKLQLIVRISFEKSVKNSFARIQRLCCWDFPCCFDNVDLIHCQISHWWRRNILNCDYPTVNCLQNIAHLFFTLFLTFTSFTLDFF